MTVSSPAKPSIVDVDAAIVFRRPLAVVLLVTFVVGALDAIGFQQYGVFTANQAGNLVIVWTLLAQSPAAAGLALASVLGCALGVVTVVLSRRIWGWLASAPGSRWLLIFASVLILVAQQVARSLTTELSTAAVADLWSADWWSECASIGLVAFSIAVLGMVFISGGGVRAPILASTNAYVDALRFGTAGLVVRDDRTELLRHARRAAGFPLAWTSGAAAAALLPLSGAALAGAGSLIVLVVAALGGRVRRATG